jgi:hypothetical protein
MRKYLIDLGEENLLGFLEENWKIHHGIQSFLNSLICPPLISRISMVSYPWELNLQRNPKIGKFSNIPPSIKVSTPWKNPLGIPRWPTFLLSNFRIFSLS